MREKVNDLQNACRFYRLRVAGTKLELIERLIEYLRHESRPTIAQLPTALRHRSQTNSDLPSVSIPVGPVAASVSPDQFRQQFSLVDPFHPIARISNPFPYIFHCRSGTTHVQVDMNDLRQYRRQGYSVWLRGISTGPSAERHVWPREMRVFVNMTQVMRVDEPKKLKKRRDDPLDITPVLSSQVNQIQFTVHDPRPDLFLIGIVICSSLPDRQIAAQVPERSVESSKRRVCDLLTQSAAQGLIVETGRIDLRCPISLSTGRLSIRFSLNSFGRLLSLGLRQRIQWSRVFSK